MSEDVRDGVQLVGTEGYDVAGEDNEVGVEAAHLVDTALQRLGPFQKRASVDVGQLDQLIAVELGRKVVEYNLYLLYLIDIAFDKQPIGQQQDGEQQGKQPPKKAAFEREVKQPREKSGDSQVKHRQKDEAYRQDD